MHKFFSKNIGWKLVSLCVATLLWIVVINTENPVLPKEIRGIKLQIRGLEALEAKGFVLQNEQELREMAVQVVVKGPRLEMQKMQDDTSKLEVMIDITPYVESLTDEDSGKIQPIELVATSHLATIQIQGVTPQIVGVVLEQEEKVTQPIQANITSQTNSEYTTLKPVLNPGAVEITGPETLVKSVYRAVVDVNVDYFSEDAISYTVPIRLLDKEGNEITGLKKSPEEIQVTLPIGKKKQVALEPKFVGSLPEGYILANTLIIPSHITIVGAPEIVNKIESIPLEAITLDNMVQSGTFNVDLILPDNVTVIDKIEGSSVVTLEIQKESTYEYRTDTSALELTVMGMPQDYILTLQSGEIAVVLSGAAEALLEVTGKPLSATVDATELGQIEQGLYSVPVVFDIPETIKIVSAPATLQVRIEPVEQPTEPEIPEQPEDSGESSEPEAESDEEATQEPTRSRY